MLLAGDLALDPLDPYPPGEEPPGIVPEIAGLSINHAAVPEGDDLVFTVALSSKSDQPVTVQYQTEDATGTAASLDYEARQGVLTFAPGQTSQQITVKTGRDLVYEHDEHFWVTLSDPGGAEIDAGRGAGTILDNDVAPRINIGDAQVMAGDAAEFLVSLSNPYEELVTVDYGTADGTARSNKDFEAAGETITFLPGETIRRISVPTFAKGGGAGEKDFAVVLSNPHNAELAAGTAEGTIAPRLGRLQKESDLLSGGGGVVALSGDPPVVSMVTDAATAWEEGTLMFSVSLSEEAPSAGVTVQWQALPGTAREEDGDYLPASGTLTFSAGSTNECIYIQAIRDWVDEYDEHFTVRLTGAQNATIDEDHRDGVATIFDADDPPTLEINDVSVEEGDEGSTSATFTVTLSGKTAKSVTVDYATQAISATPSVDYTTTSRTLSFAPDESQDEREQQITVPVLGDTLDEPDETFAVNLSNEQNATIIDGIGIGTIEDDDITVVDDYAYTGYEYPITIDVLENDSDVTHQSLTIVGVGPAASGLVEYTSDSVTYFPDETFISGTDSFTYTVTDGDGVYDTGTVDVTMVQVSDYMLEWQTPDATWEVIPDGEEAWSWDTLRWTAQFAPRDPPFAESVGWWRKPWADRDNPFVQEELFAAASGDGPVVANPDVGEWAIKPRLFFSGFANQTDFWAQLKAFARRIVANIVSTVTWDGVDPGDGNTNLTNDNPQDMGDGWKFVYGRNTPGGPVHQDVEVVARVLPKIAGIRVRFSVEDADDPTDHDGPIDTDSDTNPDLTDNRSTTNWTSATVASQVGAAGPYAEARKTLRTSTNPGDNYRVVVSADNRPAIGLVKPISSLSNPETQGRLFVDLDQDDTRDANEPILDENARVTAQGNTFLSTPLLTLWRRLYVEADSMGAPDPNINYGFDANDPAPGDIEDPDTGALASAFRPAFIETASVPAAWNQGNLVFERQFPNPRGTADQYFLTGQNPARQSRTEDRYYWTVYVAGVYEMLPQTTNNDNDPDTEIAMLGFTTNVEPEYSMIAMEIIRDVAAQHNWTAEQIAQFKRAVVVHEIGHQFELGHNGPFLGHVMSAHINDTQEGQLQQLPTTFRDEDTAAIRNHGSGHNLLHP